MSDLISAVFYSRLKLDHGTKTKFSGKKPATFRLKHDTVTVSWYFSNANLVAD